MSINLKIYENFEIKKYFLENNISEDEKLKIQIENPDKVIIFFENKKILGKLNIWYKVDKKTVYFGNIKINKKDKGIQKKIFEILFNKLKDENIEKIIAPINGNTWNDYRYVTESNGREKFLLEPFNEKEDVELFKNIGFQPMTEYFSTIMENMENIEFLDKKIEKIKEFDFYKKVEIKTAENIDLNVILSKIYEISLQVFKNNFLYSSIEKEVFMKKYLIFEDKLIKKYLKLLYVNNKIVGFVFGIPDYLELSYKSKIETIILKTLGVLPEYQNKGMGYILIDEFVKDAEKDGYKNIIFALMHENNISKNMGNKLGKIFRKYTLFEKKI